MKRSSILFCLSFLTILIFNNTVFPQWTQLTPYGGPFRAVVANGTTFYAGSAIGSLFITTNNGTNWTQIGSNQNFGNINCLAFKGSSLYVGCYNGLFLTQDNGNTWTTIKFGSSTSEVKALTLVGDNIYIGTSSGLTLSQGDSYIPLNGGLAYDGIASILAIGSKLYVSTNSNGVYTSTDNGYTWTAFKNGLPTHTSFYALGADANYLFVGTNQGTYRTPLNNNIWVKVTDAGHSAPAFCFAFYSNFIFAGVNLGCVIGSQDEGNTWQDGNSGMPLYSSQAMPYPAVFNTAYSFALGTNYLLAATDNGIYSIATLANSWNSADIGLNVGSVTSLQYSGTKIYSITSKGGFFYSSDNGNSWVNYNAGLRATPNVLGWYGSNIYSWAGSQGPLLLEDTDMRWINTDSLGTMNTAIWSILVYNSKLYLGTENGVWTAAYNYRGLTKISSGLPGGSIYSLISVGNNLFAGLNYNGVYSSTDNGVTWNTTNSSVSYLTVHCLLNVGSTLFAGAEGSAFYISTNNGSTWTPSNNGLSASRVLSLANSGNYIFAGTSNGVYFSSNNGSSWKMVNSTNMNNQNIYSLLVVGDYLFAGSNNIIYKRLISEMTSVEKNVVIPKTFGLSQNYPNPFNPSTIIKYSIPNTEFVSLKIYDLLGREVRTFVNETKTPGDYEIKLEAANLSSGIYFYKIQAGEFTQVKKMVLLN